MLHPSQWYKFTNVSNFGLQFLKLDASIFVPDAEPARKPRVLMSAFP